MQISASNLLIASQTQYAGRNANRQTANADTGTESFEPLSFKSVAATSQTSAASATSSTAAASPTSTSTAETANGATQTTAGGMKPPGSLIDITV